MRIDPLLERDHYRFFQGVLEGVNPFPQRVFFEQQVLVVNTNPLELAAVTLAFADFDAQFDSKRSDDLGAAHREGQHRFTRINAVLEHRHRPALEGQPGFVEKAQRSDGVARVLLAVVKQFMAALKLVRHQRHQSRLAAPHADRVRQGVAEQRARFRPLGHARDRLLEGCARHGSRSGQLRSTPRSGSAHRGSFHPVHRSRP